MKIFVVLFTVFLCLDALPQSESGGISEDSTSADNDSSLGQQNAPSADNETETNPNENGTDSGDTKTVDENATSKGILKTLLKFTCPKLATVSYLSVHLFRALVELVLDIFMALVSNLGLGNLGDNIVHSLETLKDYSHNGLTKLADFLGPEKRCKLSKDVSDF